MPAKKAVVRVREASRQDIPALIELNRAAYPGLASENVVWGESHLRSHLRVFPEGQLVAEVNSRLVGAVASLIVDLGPDPLAPSHLGRHHRQRLFHQSQSPRRYPLWSRYLRSSRKPRPRHRCEPLRSPTPIVPTPEQTTNPGRRQAWNYSDHAARMSPRNTHIESQRVNCGIWCSVSRSAKDSNSAESCPITCAIREAITTQA
jgi:hypothetical protein